MYDKCTILATQPYRPDVRSARLITEPIFIFVNHYVLGYRLRMRVQLTAPPPSSSPLVDVDVEFSPSEIDSRLNAVQRCAVFRCRDDRRATSIQCLPKLRTDREAQSGGREASAVASLHADRNTQRYIS